MIDQESGVSKGKAIKKPQQTAKDSIASPLQNKAGSGLSGKQGGAIDMLDKQFPTPAAQSTNSQQQEEKSAKEILDAQFPIPKNNGLYSNSSVKEAQNIEHGDHTYKE